MFLENVSVKILEKDVHSQNLNLGQYVGKH